MIREEIELSIIEHLDFSPACEGDLHRTGTKGHVIEQHASYLLTLPCGFALMYCAGRVAWVMESTQLFCNKGCHGTHRIEDARFIPL